MTITSERAAPAAGSPPPANPVSTVPPARWDRRWWAIAAAVIGSSVVAAGIDPTEIFNPPGRVQVSKFFAAMVRPDLSREMLTLTARESAVTVSYALLGSALALVIGLVGGVLLTERVWSPQHGPMAGGGRAGWGVSRVVFAVPRSMHEVVFGLLLVNILGLNPLVAVLALGIPYGAVTAKVFAELLDDVPRDAELTLRATGAGRLTAFAFGTVPQAISDLLSYAFYRFECALRGAAVLGIIGAGGLGFQLALSFQSLRYEEMWTLLWALILLSGVADRWSSAVRRRRNALVAEARLDAVDGHAATGAGSTAEGEASTGARSEPRSDRFLQVSALICAAGVPVAWWWLDLDVTSLWDDRARLLTTELVEDAWPPQIGDGGWWRLFTDSLNTIALAVLALGLSFAVSSPLSFLARRPDPRDRGPAAGVRLVGAWLLRFVLLIARSVPPPVWALIVVFVVFPGLWPAAIALAIYNTGVLGRLKGEVLENHDPRPARQLVASGATAAGALTFATVPSVAGRFVALGLYRWEVMVRETVIVGTVGAAGLGLRLDQQASNFDYDGLLATIGALFAVTLLVDFTSAAVRRTLR
ncbi:MAG: ABC transporter permease subunit [Actinomycetota bacterium]